MMKYAFAILLSFSAAVHGLIPTSPSRRTFLTTSLTLPITLISTSSLADDEPSLFSVDIFDPKNPSTSTAPKKVDPLRTSAPQKTPASKSNSNTKEDPYSEDAIRAKRAKAAGMWGGGGGKKKAGGQTLAEKMRGN
ncbi:hypothetical protein TrVE_jg6741 [Triparma verrucosa]|uniref:Uncharacterized protein n=2 Tax=Triparma TaxID=722752 RepID=A0A9W7F124_9STRA|nr:hypothetical protein TrVE_jg6741 [Triparma verrucosa]GMH98090.1 hypothetical protein TrST_g10775 [Triparma strigata]